MRFGRKARKDASSTTAPEPTADAHADQERTEGEQRTEGEATGPFDIADLDVESDEVDRVDLGGMLIAKTDDLEVRLQVEESSGDVQSVLIAGEEGALEVRAFAAPRGGDLWEDVRRQIAAQTSRQGGTATEQEGDRGTELVCVRPVKRPDGSAAQQPSRVVGVNGPRWFLRATYLGRPAMDPAVAGPWTAALEKIVVRRGDSPMAPGDPLPLKLPPQAQRMSTDG